MFSRVASGYAPAAPAEVSVLFTGRRYAGGANSRAAVWCHENGANARSSGGERLGQELITAAGTPLLTADLGGASTWGNDAAKARLTDAWAYAVAQADARTDKALLYAGSMGCLTAFAWAIDHPELVAGIVAVLPVVDLEYVHANSVNGAAALIDAAYGGAPPDFAARSVFPRRELVPDVPVQLWHSDDDPYVPLATAQAFAAAVGAESHSMGAIGHSAAGIDPAAVAAFLAACA